MNDDNPKRTNESVDESSENGEQVIGNVSGESESSTSPQLAAVTIRLFDIKERWVADIQAPGINPPGLTETYPLHDVVVYDSRVFMRPYELDDMAPNEYRECKSLFYEGPYV